MVEISNKEEFEKWLWGQNQPVLMVIAARAALRLFPIVLENFPDQTEKRDAKKLALLPARALLTSAVAGNAPTAGVKHAAHSAHTAISANLVLFNGGIVIGDESNTESRSVLISTDSTALSASFARSAVAYAAEIAAASAIATVIANLNDSAANSARSAALSAAYSDAHLILSEAAADLLETPIWGDEQFGGVIKSAWEGFLQDTLPNAPEFSFWRDWYQGFLDGKPLDWALQREVALIPDADWEKGAAHIAGVIEGIKARFLTNKAPLAEKLELNPETGKFFVTPVPARKPDLLNTTLEKAADALDDALNGRNGLLADDRVARVLRRCFEKYNHNPERIEMDFVDAHVGLTRQMASGELAESEEILSLAEVLKNGALDIRANHPDIAANRETRAARALQELTPEQKQQLADAQPVLEAITEAEAHQDMGADIPELINDMIGPVPKNGPPAGPAVRVFNRAAKMSFLARSKEAIAAIEGNSGFKMVRISLVLKSIIDIGLKIFGLF